MIGYIAGALTTIAFAPQLLKALSTKSTKDVSLMMLLCSTSGMLLWLFHGILVNDSALVVANAISFLLAFFLLGLKIKNDCTNSTFKPWKNPGNLRTAIHPLNDKNESAQLYIEE